MAGSHRSADAPVHEVAARDGRGRRVAAPALAHRIVLDYAARLEGYDARQIVAALLEAVPEVERGLPVTLESR